MAERAVKVSETNGPSSYVPSRRIADMGYHVVNPEEVEPMEGRSAETLPIGEAAGLKRRDDKLGLRLYVADPGEQLPLRYHYHDEQVEAFYVVEGTLHVETPEGEYVVEADWTFVGAPSVEDAHAYEPEEHDAEE